MSTTFKKFIQYILLFALGGLLVYLSIRKANVSQQELIQAFSDANMYWILLSILLSFISHIIRAYRWNYLLENYNHHTDLFTSTASVLIGYLTNYGLPRMGEISRCSIVAKYNHIPFDIALGTVIAERAVDLLLTCLIFILVIILPYNDLHTLLNKYIISPLVQKFSIQHLILLFLLILLSVIFLIILFKSKNTSSAPSLIKKIIQALKNLIQPLLSIHKIKRPWGFWFWSIIIWLLYYLSMYFCSLSLTQTTHLGMYKILVLFLFGTFGVIATPGGIGAYHFLLTELLLFYQVNNADAVAFPWIIWGTQFLLILFLGGLSFILLPIFQTNKTHHNGKL